MARGKSTIPPKLQIPIVIIGAILLIVIGIWRFQGMKKKSAPVPNPSSVAVSSESAPGNAALEPEASETAAHLQALLQTVADMQNNRESIQKNREEYVAVVREYRPLARSPFQVPAEPIQIQALATNGQGTPGNIELDTNRKDRIESLVLQATSLTNGSILAIVNGKVIRVGDTFEGFRLRTIENRKIILEDDQGTVVIEMEGIPEL